MQQSWTLSFRDFGKVRYGEIDIAPLVLIIGDNNSGKSYVMSLLWGVLTEGRKLFPKEVPSSILYQEVDHFLEEIIGQNKKLTAEDTSLFIEWFNDILKNKKQDLLQRIFRKKMSVSSLRIENYQRKKPLELRFEQKDSTEMNRYSSSQDYVRLPYTLKTREQATERYRMAQYITWTLLMDQLSSPFYPVGGRRSIESRAIGEALYLPASRTGFMLTYRSLVQDMMEKVIDQEDEEDIEFTLPVYRFLQGLIRLDEKSKSNYEDIGLYLESNILKGTMKQEKGILPAFYYHPQGKSSPLPLYLSSSLVTELSPLILFLKSKTTYRSLFLEEAEAHLHPKVQRILATALVKIVNREMPVWVTTHSDIILQQLNNLIKLAGHPKQAELMEKYGYVEEDMLLPDRVKAYQFTATEKGTIITKLQATPYGFPAETFNQVILDLNEETMAFQVDEEDE